MSDRLRVTLVLLVVTQDSVIFEERILLQHRRRQGLLEIVPYLELILLIELIFYWCLRCYLLLPLLFGLRTSQRRFLYHSHIIKSISGFLLQEHGTRSYFLLEVKCRQCL